MKEKGPPRVETRDRPETTIHGVYLWKLYTKGPDSPIIHVFTGRKGRFITPTPLTVQTRHPHLQLYPQIYFEVQYQNDFYFLPLFIRQP